MILEILVAGFAICHPIEIPPAEPEIHVRTVKTVIYPLDKDAKP